MKRIISPPMIPKEEILCNNCFCKFETNEYVSVLIDERHIDIIDTCIHCKREVTRRIWIDDEGKRI
jgi:Leu/Phe-tRNA-protein transferase